MTLKETPTKIKTPDPEIASNSGVNYDRIYSDWSSWGRCTKRCREVRWRHCKLESECGDSTLREERHCSGGRCQLQTEKPFVVPQGGEVTQRGRSPSEFRVLYHLQSVVYSTWSDWSPCTRACRTKRHRNCKVSVMCGNSVIQEDALCYQEGSACEKIYKRKRQKVKEENYELLAQLNNEEDSIGQSNPLDEQDCGLPDIDDDMNLRIIGGRETVKGRWPWQVIILNRFREPFCGGTVLSPYWVLTAAHCVRRRLFIRAGEHDLVEQEGTEQEIRVKEAISHPEYDAETVDNDIALLLLQTPLTLDRDVKPACLPQPEETLPLQARAFILGWGKRRDSAIYGTDVLHEAEVPVVDIEDCKAVYEDYYISENMLCAGYKRGRVDSCAGDSGGPLLYRSEEGSDGSSGSTGRRWAIYGVTSFGDGCGRKGKFGIYAKVSNYVRWIRRTVAGNG